MGLITNPDLRRGLLSTAQNVDPACEMKLCCVFIRRLRLRAAIKYSSIIPYRENDENKQCSTRLLTEKKVNSHLLLFTERLRGGAFLMARDLIVF